MGDLIDASGRPEFKKGGCWLNRGRRLPLEIAAVRIVSLKNFREGGSDFCELEELSERFDYVVFSESCFLGREEKLYVLDSLKGKVCDRVDGGFEYIRGGR
ncbi:hypothetical protein HNV12_00395 [Methanococcoides sp. SA1]|nr:hypothetical protein [Methanococcoides sp. SA1]